LVSEDRCWSRRLVSESRARDGHVGRRAAVSRGCPGLVQSRKPGGGVNAGATIEGNAPPNPDDDLSEKNQTMSRRFAPLKAETVTKIHQWDLAIQVSSLLI
jgi:hypothetical protein